jgi:IS1 family transposase
MGMQVNAKEILSLLYYNREVIDFLFGNRDSITVNELLGRADITAEQYQKLVAYYILY